MVENNGKANGGHIGKNYGKPWKHGGKPMGILMEKIGKNRKTW